MSDLIDPYVIAPSTDYDAHDDVPDDFVGEKSLRSMISTDSWSYSEPETTEVGKNCIF